MAPRARRLVKSIHSPDLARFCQVMIDARKEAGLTQQKLAHRLRKPQSFVAKYENGERRLDVLEFMAIAHALDQDPLQLMEALTR